MKNGTSDNLTFWSEEHLASLSALPESEVEQTTLEGASCTHILELWRDINRRGFYGKTYPAYYLPAADMILHHFSPVWSNAGMGGAIGCLTLNISECPNYAVECSLSDILMIGQTLPQKYYLSNRACAGIVRRAKKRGNILPDELQKALMSTVYRYACMET